ncbi:unnamed protein product [Merluccius merluccius]
MCVQRDGRMEEVIFSIPLLSCEEMVSLRRHVVPIGTYGEVIDYLPLLDERKTLTLLFADHIIFIIFIIVILLIIIMLLIIAIIKACK